MLPVVSSQCVLVLKHILAVCTCSLNIPLYNQRLPAEAFIQCWPASFIHSINIMRLLSVLIQFFSVTQYTTLALTTYRST